MSHPLRHGFNACLRSVGEGSSQIFPINIGTQIFRRDGIASLRTDPQTQAFAETLTHRTRLTQVANGRAAAHRKFGLPVWRQTVQICE